MDIVYARVEKLDGEIEGYELSKQENLDSDRFFLIKKSYLYSLYYYPITTNKISESDLQDYGIYDPPFNKAVFILNKDNSFYKLNCSLSPVEYHLSTFDPETQKSKIITSQSRELFNSLRMMLKVLPWEEYKQLYNFGSFLNEKSSTDSGSGMVVERFPTASDSVNSFQGGGLTLELDKSSPGLTLDTPKDEPALQFTDTSAHQPNYNDVEDNSQSKPNKSYKKTDYDSLPIEQRRLKLKELKDDLVNAKKIENIKKSLKTIKKQINYYKVVKESIKRKESDIEDKNNTLVEFNDISWITENKASLISKYENSLDKLKAAIASYDERVKKVDKTISNMAHDDIFKNKLFMISFIAALITFIASWIDRDMLRFLSLGSIAFFTASLYFVWGYIDYIDALRKLKRERKFFIKKIRSENKDFETEYGAVRDELKDRSILSIPQLMERYDKKLQLTEKIDTLKRELEEYRSREFNSDKESEYNSLLKQNDDLTGDLGRLSKKELIVDEIEHKITQLKVSIKTYEKKELDQFSLDDEDDLSLDDSGSGGLELESETKPEDNFIEMDIQSLSNYINSFETIFAKKGIDIYNLIEKDFIDIANYSIHFNHKFEIDFDNNIFKFHYDPSIEWDRDNINKFKFFIQYSILKYGIEKFQNPLFLDTERLQNLFQVYMVPYLDEFPKIQIIYK